MARTASKKMNKVVKKESLQIYCRRCMQHKVERDVYTSTDSELDKNGYMSICKKCCSEIYNNSYTIEHNFEKALLRTCKILNVAWVPNAVDAAKTQVMKWTDEGKTDIQVFGIYKSKLSTLSNLAGGSQLTFDNSDTKINISQEESVTNDEDFNKYLNDFWGPNLSFENYEFLESELSRYKKTHKCDTATEESLLRQICFAELDIRNARVGGGTPNTSLIKQLQELMKTASIDPAKASSANSGSAKDTFSSFIKIIEENEPASYYGQDSKKLFKDFDNIDFYFKKYVTRPLKNFITQSRDFNVDTEDDIDEIVDSEE